MQVGGKRGRNPPAQSQDEEEPLDDCILLTTKARRLNRVNLKTEKKLKKLKKTKPKMKIIGDHHPLPLPHAVEGKRERDIDISRQLPRAKRRRRPHVEGYLGIAANS